MKNSFYGTIYIDKKVATEKDEKVWGEIIDNQFKSLKLLLLKQLRLKKAKAIKQR